jgi:hypothetical protein
MGRKPSDEEVLDLFRNIIPRYISERKEKQQDWDDDLLQKYWTDFLRFVELNGNKLKDLHFPKLFGFSTDEVIFSSEVNKLVFDNCTFHDQAYFKEWNVEKFQFSNCWFSKTLSFADFTSEELNIENSTFGENLSLYNSNWKSFILDHCKIFGSFNANDIIFSNIFKIDDLSIADSISLKKCYLSAEKEATLTGLNVIDLNLMDYEWLKTIENIKTEIQDEQQKVGFNSYLLRYHFQILNKENLKKYIDRELKQERTLSVNKEQLFKKIDILHDLKYLNYKSSVPIHFENVIVTQPFTFHWLNLEKFGFLYSEIENIKFSSCEWNIKNRLIIASEDYKSDRENQYRQLKRIFAKEQDWEMSGYAYVSEMEMRKKRLGYDINFNKKNRFKNLLEYLTYWFYDIFGGYTQNFTRPLIFLILLTFIIFPGIYLLIDYSFFKVWSFTESFQKSLASALPLINTKYYNENWWLQTFQIIFSSILLTFIVLGLRKRFKQ